MTVLLADLSNNNTVTSPTAIKAAGVTAVWHKVTEGDHFTDKFWKTRARALRLAGIRVGGYHFARPENGTARAQARHFCEQLGQITFRDLRPALDLEVNDRKMPPATLTAWAREFNQEVRRITGVGPVFYSYLSFIQTQLHPAKPIGYGLWLSVFGPDDGHDHPVQAPAPWKRVAAHQFTDKGRIPGVQGTVDLSHAVSLRPLLAHPVKGLL